MATLSAGQTQSVLSQDAASCAPSSSVAVCVGILCIAVSAMTMLIATCASMYMQFRCKSILPLRIQAKQRWYTIQHYYAIAEKENTLPGDHYTLVFVHVSLY